MKVIIKKYCSRRGDYIANMMRLIRFKDTPLGVANEPALYIMSVKLKKFITVVLSGEGSDEILAATAASSAVPMTTNASKSCNKTDTATRC